jgi:hypothetical protein
MFFARTHFSFQKPCTESNFAVKTSTLSSVLEVSTSKKGMQLVGENDMCKRQLKNSFICRVALAARRIYYDVTSSLDHHGGDEASVRLTHTIL